MLLLHANQGQDLFQQLPLDMASFRPSVTCYFNVIRVRVGWVLIARISPNDGGDNHLAIFRRAP
ncbi:hypothetical protein [Geotalea sp. SG265]|uniref:hypothetical protein n=1 Tax=Geotalea sp. SG265 TaxID=2922867 RepID=UPI001FAEFEAB|nr:hypothetical protein [Geotalea sp. SG265]